MRPGYFTLSNCWRVQYIPVVSKETLHEELARLIHDMGARSRATMTEIVSELDLSPPQAWALRSLEEPLTMGELAHRLFYDASYVTALADALEERGLAERRPDPSDRRVKQLVLTDRGREVNEEIARRMRRRHPLFENLSTRDLEALRDILRRV